MSDLRASKSLEDAGQNFVSFAQIAGACVVHTFFGTAPGMQSVSTLPASYTKEEGRAALATRNHIVEPIRAGEVFNYWGVDFEHLVENPSELGTSTLHNRLEDFRQRSSVTYSMPNANGTYNGAGIGIGFEDRGDQFIRRMSDTGGAFSVAAFAAYQVMLNYRSKTSAPSPLSKRQAEILTLLAAGHRLGEIADRLGISDSAVNLYLSNLRQKLSVRTKEEAMAVAISNGWVAP